MVNVEGDINRNVIVSKTYFKDIITEKGSVLKLINESDDPPKPFSTKTVGNGTVYKKYRVADVLDWVGTGWWTRKDEELTRSGYIHSDKLPDHTVEFAALRKRLAKLEGMLGDVSVGYDKHGLLNLGTIKSTRQPIHRICGVYFLFKGEELIYIGQSINVMGRINTHNIEGWDTFSYVEVPKSDLDIVEKEYILKYKPRKNGTYLSTKNQVTNRSLFTESTSTHEL
tara:strand:+ start:19 stop:696 length:678 start_codon:yes stop_codon:yes gene_type:complete